MAGCNGVICALRVTVLIVTTLIAGSSGQCGSDLTAIRDVDMNFTSPNFPNDYPDSTNCTWTITTDASSTVSLYVAIMELESGSTCQFDNVSVYDGASPDSPLLATLCGNLYAGQHLFSSGPDMYITFMSDSSITRNGFVLQYTAIDPSAERELGACDANSSETLTATRDETKSIFSPNYPYNHHHLAECLWNITTDANSIVRLYVAVMDMEEGPICQYDSLSIHDGVSQDSTVVARLCGNRYPGQYYYSSGPYMLVSFISDESISSQGFELQYTAIDPNDEQTIGPCGPDTSRALTATRNVNMAFSSPNYPNAYPRFAECAWNITADVNSIVRVYVAAINMEEESICQYDYVAVYDGASHDAMEVARLCSDRYPGQYYYSSGPYMFIRFISDGTIVGPGVELQYTAVDPNDEKTIGPCGPDSTMTLTATQNVNGSIFSPSYPNNYPNYASCSWVITAPLDYEVQLFVAEVELEDRLYCPHDKISVYNGGSQDHSLRLTICEIDFRGVYIYSSGRNMYINFTSDGSSTFQGFELQYTAVHSAMERIDNIPVTWADTCTEAVELSASSSKMTYLESPNYPNNYPRGYSCAWRIQSEPGYVVQLSVMDMELELHRNCSYDGVTITDTDETSVLAMLCHPNAKGNVFVSSGRVLMLNFTSDESIVNKGFRFGYEAILAEATTSTPLMTTTVAGRAPGSELTSTAMFGIVLGTVILVCLIVIGVLIYQLRRRPKHPPARSGVSGVSPPSAIYNNQDQAVLVNADYTSSYVSTPHVYSQVPPAAATVASALPVKTAPDV